MGLFGFLGSLRRGRRMAEVAHVVQRAYGLVIEPNMFSYASKRMGRDLENEGLASLATKYIAIYGERLFAEHGTYEPELKAVIADQFTGFCRNLSAMKRSNEIAHTLVARLYRVSKRLGADVSVLQLDEHEAAWLKEVEANPLFDL